MPLGPIKRLIDSAPRITLAGPADSPFLTKPYLESVLEAWRRSFPSKTIDLLLGQPLPEDHLPIALGTLGDGGSADALWGLLPFTYDPTTSHLATGAGTYQGTGLQIISLVPRPGQWPGLLSASVGPDGLGRIHRVVHGSTDYVIARDQCVLEEGTFHGSPTRVERATLRKTDWKTLETDHYLFHARPRSFALRYLDQVGRYQESVYDRLSSLTGRHLSAPIQYFLYESQEDKAKSGHGLANAQAYPALLQIHAVLCQEIWAVGAHEDTHVFAHFALGRAPLRLLAEGLAVYADNHWYDIDLHSWARALMASNMFIEARTLIDAFSSYPEIITYPLSGSLVKFLIDQFGFEPFRQLYVAPAADVDCVLSQYYGAKLDVLNRDWCYLVRQSPPDARCHLYLRNLA